MTYSRTTASQFKAAHVRLRTLIEMIDIYSDVSFREYKEEAISKANEISDFIEVNNPSRFISKANKIVIKDMIEDADKFIAEVTSKMTDGNFSYLLLKYRVSIGDLIRRYNSKNKPVEATVVSRIMYGFKEINDSLKVTSSFKYRSIRDHLSIHSNHTIESIWSYKFRYILNDGTDPYVDLYPYYLDALVCLMDEITESLKVIGLIEE